MKPSKNSTFRRSSSILAAVSFAMSLTAAHAASLTWDGSDTVTSGAQGGAGTWNMNSTANWWNGATDQVWPNTGSDNDAIFANTAGTVTLAGVTANDLTFNTTGYLIQSNTLTLNGTTPTITTATGVTTTINSTISGSAGLVKTGAGTLILGTANNYTGTTTINAGTLQFSSAAALPTGSAVSLTTAGAKLTLGSPGQALAWVAGSAVAQAIFSSGYAAAYAIDGNLATRWAGGATGSWIYADLGSSQNIGHFKINWEAARSTSFVIQTSSDASNWTNASSTLSSSAANVWETYSLNAGASGRYVRMLSSVTINGGASIWEMQALAIASGAGTYTLASLSGVAGTVVDLLGIGNTLKAGSDNSDTAFAGSLLGGATDSFVKEGTGTLTWVGTANYLVAPTVTAGTLKLDLSGLSGVGATGLVVPGGNVNVGANGILQLHTGTNTVADTTSFGSGAITGSGTITKTGTGYLGLILSVGVRDFTGLIDIQQGILGNNGPGWGSGAGAMDLNIAADAMLDMRTENVKIDALGGAGTIEKTWAGNLTLSLGNNDGSATFSGVISQTIGGGSGTIAVIKNGSGTQTLSGANNYAGGTTINAGTLLVNNTTGSGTGSGAVTVSGGTLGGTGSIAGAVTLNGGTTLAPGASIESLTTGALTMNTGTTFAYEMNSTVGSYAADLLVGTGGVTLNGTVQLGLTDVLGEAATPFAGGTVLTLINYAGVLNGGFFYGTALGEGDTFTAGLNTWKINYNAATGGLNFTGVTNPGSHFINLTAIPEPGSWLALGCLVGSGMFLRSRRRH